MRTSVIRLVSKFVLNVILESTDSVSVQVIAFSALLSPYTYRLVAKFDNCSFFFFDDSKLVRNFGGGGRVQSRNTSIVVMGYLRQ